jgi:hypothetical protein
LEAVGYQVLATIELAGLSRITVSIDLVILCHTLSLEECGRALALASIQWPIVRTLVLAEGQLASSKHMLDQVLDAIGKKQQSLPVLQGVAGQ